MTFILVNYWLPVFNGHTTVTARNIPSKLLLSYKTEHIYIFIKTVRIIITQEPAFIVLNRPSVYLFSLGKLGVGVGFL